MKLPKITTKHEFKEFYQSETWLEAARQICEKHKIIYKNLERAGGTEHIVFFVDDKFVIKIYAPFRRGFEREKAALRFAHGKTSLKIPEIVAAGEIENFNYLVLTRLSGELMTRAIWLALPEKEQIKITSQLARGLKELHSRSADSFDFDWHEFVEYQSKTALERQIAANVNPELIEKLPDFIETNLKLLPENPRKVFLHGDVHFGNLRLQKINDDWEISGLFDFADSLAGFNEYDFVAVGLLMIQGQKTVQREFFKAYGYEEKDLDEAFRKRLMLLTVLYECSDLRRYALRLKPEAVDFSLEELEKAIWCFA